MATSSGSGLGSGSGSTAIRESGSEEDLMDVRKRKRMVSNRESARRSRMRKQKHLDDLTAQAAQLRRNNGQFFASLTLTAEELMRIEGENSVLRSQVGELSHRLESLNEILCFLGGSFGNGPGTGAEVAIDGVLENSWSYVYLNQPIMASADASVGLF